MSDKPVLQPGPDHPITVTPNPAHVVVTVAGKIVADTTAAQELREADYPPVQYVPRADVDMSVLQRTDHETYCPFKGESAYYSVDAGSGVVDNVVWTYEAPYDAVAPIKDHLAFYADRPEIDVEVAAR
ncbi:DUF427 domain-containing protein [uncultured Jatrophihabitans sp.]|uniref:DUF427 domain-containing protein n=1 Tax=uncultured Jatrophihabitans sp. TaxID=1610747 RepID=UPI0035CB7066